MNKSENKGGLEGYLTGTVTVTILAAPPLSESRGAVATVATAIGARGKGEGDRRERGREFSLE